MLVYLLYTIVYKISIAPLQKEHKRKKNSIKMLPLVEKAKKQKTKKNHLSHTKKKKNHRHLRLA